MKKLRFPLFCAALASSILTLFIPITIYLTLLLWCVFAGEMAFSYAQKNPVFLKYPQLIGLNIALNLLPRLFSTHPARANLLLDKTEQVVRKCILGSVPGMDAIGGLLFGGVRVMFVFAVVAIVFKIWQKHQHGEDVGNWMGYLASLLIGAGIVSVFESVFIGDNATSGCSAGKS